MRISSAQYFQLNVTQMNDQQAQLAQLYQQIASGVSLQTAADNPVGAAQAVQLSMTSATLSQYATNQTTALASLQAEDQALQNVSGVLTSAQTLLVRAGDGSLSDSNRAALATQLQGYRDQLLTLANTNDGAGTYLFAGTNNSAPPFKAAPNGSVAYVGDTGTRDVQIADSSTVSQSDTGAAVFMSVPAIGSTPVPSAGAANAGTATIGTVAVTNPAAATNGHQFAITFGGTPAAPTYTVTDNSVSPPSTTPAQAYSAGSAISLGNGMTVAVSGTPAVGDTFAVDPAPQASGGADIFSTLDAMISALNKPVTGNPVASAALTNALMTGSTKLGNTMRNVTTIQASVGGREQEVKAMQAVNQSAALQTSSNLSDLTSTNMVTTISQYLQVQNALTGAQKAYVQLQNMSLFQYINP
ncbi:MULTISPECIES: flagellar hook-associated protein FlgL [Burkholderia]|uniref:Flagellar hook-associated protein FlgL n=1 Tax=Burkholderia anthinoferrum TaxID=3090833 RepID=A0ABU5WSB3_9BURK|nr:MULTISPECIES: flagellar hook-associated protein FlgL [Burkholderia]MEB2504881.1 flagellar hook-associated protein FlgL [Burkholderia anthinoferrum]MEB2531714.1 flagellar hook-associated protein FlgL [Burkholderia anthinoferrum]MEB2563101.1 flagellar hook-associated protein FlgL [Burkholderia anthinoferrum]MEB2581766.1 flagellar hook-associated protein FlgL [Burkholderia anthinoferrum]KVH04605.1 flagellar biosynthesis protein FlgL [Burkholderia anthina]